MTATGELVYAGAHGLPSANALATETGAHVSCRRQSQQSHLTEKKMKSTGRWLAALALLVHALGASGAHAQSCAVPLLKFGPISPVHGFPMYYQDSTLLGLQPEEG